MNEEVSLSVRGIVGAGRCGLYFFMDFIELGIEYLNAFVTQQPLGFEQVHYFVSE